MFKIAAFDLDGTLADTIPMCLEAFRNSVSPRAGHMLSEAEILQTFGLNETGMIKAISPQNWKMALHDFYLAYEALHSQVTEPFPGIPGLLAFLKKKQIRLALITGKGEKSCAISLAALGLSDTFDEVLCGSEYAPNKRENMEYLLQKYSLTKNELCYIGDTLQDVRDSQAAGITCFSAAWQKSSHAAALETANPGHVFGHVRDLQEYLRSLLTRMPD